MMIRDVEAASAHCGLSNYFLTENERSKHLWKHSRFCIVQSWSFTHVQASKRTPLKRHEETEK